MLLKEGIRRASPKPIHLEATTANSRDIYARYGFEVSLPLIPRVLYSLSRNTADAISLLSLQINSEDWFGVGEVDKNGIKARGQEAATGFPEWIMTKVRELVVVMSNDSQNFLATVDIMNFLPHACVEGGSLYSTFGFGFVVRLTSGC